MPTAMLTSGETTEAISFSSTRMSLIFFDGGEKRLSRSYKVGQMNSLSNSGGKTFWQSKSSSPTNAPVSWPGPHQRHLFRSLYIDLFVGIGEGLAPTPPRRARSPHKVAKMNAEAAVDTRIWNSWVEERSSLERNESQPNPHDFRVHCSHQPSTHVVVQSNLQGTEDLKIDDVWYGT